LGLGRTGGRSGAQGDRGAATQITPVWQLTEPRESPGGEEKSSNFTASDTTGSIFSNARNNVFVEKNVSVIAESSLVGHFCFTAPHQME